MNRPKILTTLGPKSLTKSVIRKLSDRNVDYFRINMSHTTIDQLESHILKIRKYSDTSICIDSEGAQIRTGLSSKDIILNNREEIKIVPSTKTKGKNELGIWPTSIFNQIKPGNVLTVDFNSVLLLISKTYRNYANAIVLNGGKIGSNKAITISPKIKLPALSKKDILAVEMGIRYNIHNFALSFTNRAEDVTQLRDLTGKSSKIISKIESIEGIENLDSILKLVDAILIDRGDLSREVPLENIPFLQKLIIKKAHSHSKEVYVATNLLESMLKNTKPTRAELNDVVNTLIDGANGLVLAAETAIGDHPIESVDILTSLINRYLKSLNGHRISDLLNNESLLLPSFHGEGSKNLDSKKIDSVHTHGELEIDENNYLDCIQFSNKVYSPLKGFMSKKDLDSVLDNYKLESGETWTLPIILQIKKEKWIDLKNGTSISLNYKHNKDYKIILRNISLYTINLDDVSKKWFLTTDMKHPGVKRLFKNGSYIVSGAIQVTKGSDNIFSPYLLTPKQTRMIFNIKGWTRVVAFHTRNVPHRAHEYIMKKAVEKSNADGLLIQPVIGPKKRGDFSSKVILNAYDILIENYIPDALLCGFSTYSRYSGPREAVFTALCRKNYGCTHFIIGRDHTGVGDYYKNISPQDLFMKLGDIGIEIIYFNRVGYDEKEKKIREETVGDKKMNLKSISGSLIRSKLESGSAIQEEILRKEIQEFLKDQIKNKKILFTS